MPFATFEALLRKAVERTVEGPGDVIARNLETFQPQECKTDFTASCHDPT